MCLRADKICLSENYLTRCKDLLVNIDDVGKTGEEVREYEWSELSNQKVTIILRVFKII